MESSMKLYAIVTLPENTIHHDKTFISKALALRELEEYGYTVNMFNQILDNGLMVGKLAALKLITE